MCLSPSIALQCVHDAAQMAVFPTYKGIKQLRLLYLLLSQNYKEFFVGSFSRKVFLKNLFEKSLWRLPSIQPTVGSFFSLLFETSLHRLIFYVVRWPKTFHDFHVWNDLYNTSAIWCVQIGNFSHAQNVAPRISYSFEKCAIMASVHLLNGGALLRILPFSSDFMHESAHPINFHRLIICCEPDSHCKWSKAS